MSDTEAYSNKLASLEEIYHLLPKQRQRRLTIPAIFGRAYDENFISDYLAYILNPEVNGIGIAPLQALLELIEEEGLDPDSKVTIEREHTFPDGGRIDFLIQLDEDTILAIENKITASEGWQQTLSYERSIANEFPNQRYCLVFLTPTGTTASSNRFQSLSYADLYHSWRAIPVSPLPDIHKSVIWEDFLAHLEDYITMENRSLNLSEKTLLYLKHKEILDDLILAIQQDAQARLDHTLALLKTLFPGWTVYGRPGEVSHWYVKKEWYLDSSTYAFANYYFRANDLIRSQSIPFGVGVYPLNPTARPFVDFFNAQYRDAVSSYCLQYNMQAFPKKGGQNFWIAWKDYSFDPLNSAEVTQLFTKSREEMKPLEEIIDRAIKVFSENR